MYQKKKNANPNKWPSSIFKKAPNFRKLSCSLILIWTLLLFLVLTWNWLQVKAGTHKEALIALRMTVEKDLTFRTWATGHGGVYVPITAKLQPNPYLQHMENRDITILTGEKLTLLNPAYIMRQVYELRYDSFGVYNRLTSLNPINPRNAADPWEAKALETFAENKNLDEFGGLDLHFDQSAIRLIQPFIMEDGCLKCHGHQGYQVGDLAGGISASIPLAPYAALIRSRQLALLPGYILIWLFGLAGITWFMYRIQMYASNLLEEEARNRALVQAMPDVIFRYSAGGFYLDAEIKTGSPMALFMQEKTKDTRLIGQKIATILPETPAQTLMAAIKKVVKTGEMQFVKYSYAIQGKEFHFEDRLVLEGNNEVISIVRDITQQKGFETKLEYLSYHDQLTKLYNRNYFERQLKQGFTEKDYPLSVLMADVNGLKLINDALGHTLGDKLLTECAKVLRQSLRGSDMLARIGGDEFIAILPRTNETVGRTVLERIRQNVDRYNQENPCPPLSIALGMATAKNNSEPLLQICDRADDAMYQEKLAHQRTGKDKMIELLIASANNNCSPNLDPERLQEISTQMGRKINLSEARITKLGLLCQMQDLGKVAIEGEILSKNIHTLTQEEREVLKKHAEKGYRIALSSTEFLEIAELILKHHEKWDGSGYPLGLKGKEIPIECRILAITNMFIALTTPEPGQVAMNLGAALKQIKDQSGSAFDPELVEIFLALKKELPFNE